MTRNTKIVPNIKKEQYEKEETFMEETEYEEEEEEEDMMDDDDEFEQYYRNKKRSWLSKKLRSLFVFFSLSMTMTSLLTVIVSVIWLVVFLMVSDGFIGQVRSNGFNRLERAVKSMYQEPALVARSITAAQDEEIFSSEQSFNAIKHICERAILWNQKSFVAGSQLFYANEDRVVGVKKSNDVNVNRMELFYQWNSANYRDQLPNPASTNFSIHYVYYDSFTPENITLQSFPYRFVPYVPLTTQLVNSWNRENTTGAIKERWTDARLIGCAEEGQICAFVQPYLTSRYSEGEKGYFSMYIQASYVSEILKNITYDGETAIVVDRMTGNVLGSSLEHIKAHYMWNKTLGAHTLIHAKNYPDELIVNQLNYLRTKYGEDYAGISETSTTSDSMYNGVSKYLMDARVYSEPGMSLVIISTVPEWHFIGTTTTIGIILSVLSVIALVFSLILGLCTSCIIYRPLRDFLRNLVGITDGLDLERIQFSSRPFFTEFDQLQSSFQYLVNKLKLYRTFLPEHILKQVDSSEYQEKVDPAHHQSETISVASSGSIKTGVSSSHQSYSSFDSFVNDENRKLLGLGLTSDRASFVSIKLHYHNQSPSANMRIFSELFNKVISVGNNRQANVEFFSRDSILLGFNTVKKVKNHMMSACVIALSIEQILTGCSDVGFGIGVSTGNSFMGTIGSKTKRMWSCMGLAVDHANELSEHSRTLNLGILFDENIKNGINTFEFQYRLVDMIAEGRMSVHDIYQLVSKVVNKDDEWIYELKNMESSTWTLKYAKAINFMLADELNEAQAMIDEFVDEQPNDLVGKRVQDIIHFLVNNGIDWSAYIHAVHDKYTMNVGRSYYSIFTSKMETSSLVE